MSYHTLISRGLIAWIAALFLLAPLHPAARGADTVRPLASFSFADDVSELGWLNSSALGGTNTLRIKLSPVTATGDTLAPADLDTARVPTVASFTASGFTVSAVSTSWQDPTTAPYVIVTLTATTDAAGDTSSLSAVSLVANDNAFYDLAGNGSRSTAADSPYVNGLGVISFVGLDRSAPGAGTVTYTPPFAGTTLPLKISINFSDAVSGVNSNTISADNFFLTSGSNTTTPVATVTVAPDTVDARIAVYTFTPTTAWALGGNYTLRVNNDVTKRVYDNANSTPFQPLTANPMAAGALQLDGSAVTFTPTTLKPTVTDARISIAGASGSGGVFRIGDTVTATWNNTVGGDNNFFAMASVTMDFRSFGGGAAVAATNNAGVWTASYTIVPGTIEATGRNVSVTATDSFAASTTTTADSTNATVDNRAPGIPSTPVLAASLDTGASASDGITKTNALYFTGTAEAGSLVTVRRGGVGALGTVTANGAGGWLFNYTGTPLADGTYTFAATAADAAGNVSGASADLSVIVDNTPPAISLSAPSAPSTVSGPISYTVTYSDANFSASTLALGDITLNKTGTADGTVSVTGTGTTRTVTISNITGSGTLGISIAAGTARDLAGNLAPASGASTTFSMGQLPFITNSTLAVTGTYRTAFPTYTIAAGNSPTSYSATGLPPGLAINTVTGAITGTPTTVVGSPFSVTIGATNVGGTGTATLVITVAKAPLTVTAASFTKAAGAALPTFTTSISGFLNGETLATSGVTGSAAVSTSATASSPAGTYAITPAVGSLTAANYAFSNFVPGVLTVIDLRASHGAPGRVYPAGGTVTISASLTYSGAATNLKWSMLLPTGWSYAQDTAANSSAKPTVGATSLLEWTWTTVPTSPVIFTTTLNVPVGETGDKSIVSQITFRAQSTGDTVSVLATPDPLVLVPVAYHDADSDHNFRINLFELTRAIELYNTRNASIRTGAYKVQAGSEDGFAPDLARANATVVTLTRYHSADADRNGKLDLLELTRVIELYNYVSGTNRTGEYHAQTGTEDGFAAGP